MAELQSSITEMAKKQQQLFDLLQPPAAPIEAPIEHRAARVQVPPAGAPPALAPPALEVVAQAALPRSCSSTRATAVGVELLQDADLRI